MKSLVLLGYMGCGKSTVGALLAQDLAFDFLDLDQYISSKEAITIPQIFSQHGEVYFRKLESKYLLELLDRKGLVLSLGGGTPCYANNMQEIKKSNVPSVYLRASANTLFLRLEREREKRPLIANLPEDILHEFIRKHLFERNPFYAQADFTINVDLKIPSQIAQEIRDLIEF